MCRLVFVSHICLVLGCVFWGARLEGSCGCSHPFGIPWWCRNGGVARVLLCCYGCWGCLAMASRILDITMVFIARDPVELNLGRNKRTTVWFFFFKRFCNYSSALGLQNQQNHMESGIRNPSPRLRNPVTKSTYSLASWHGSQETRNLPQVSVALTLGVYEIRVGKEVLRRGA